MKIYWQRVILLLLLLLLLLFQRCCCFNVVVDVVEAKLINAGMMTAEKLGWKG